MVMSRLSGRVSTTTRLSSGLMVSINTITPTSVTTEVISCVRLCCRVVLMLSMSLTARLRISPRVRESKNFSGRRESFSSTSLRSRYTILCATPAITYCWTYMKMALIMYSPSKSSKTVAMYLKSIPGAGWCSWNARYFASSPSKSLVVANPRIFGPTMLNVVPRMAAPNTTSKRYFCGTK